MTFVMQELESFFFLQICKPDFVNLNLNLLFKHEPSQQGDTTCFQGQIRVLHNLLFVLLHKSGGARKIIHLLTFDSFLTCSSDIRAIVGLLFSLCACVSYLLSINRECVGLKKASRR